LQPKAKEAAHARSYIIQQIFKPNGMFDPVHGGQTPSVQPSHPITGSHLQQHVFRSYAGLFPVTLVDFKEVTHEEVSEPSTSYRCQCHCHSHR
jgi:hypothetical protein